MTRGAAAVVSWSGACSRHRSGHAVADVLAEPMSQLLETHNYDLVIIDSPPGEPNLQLLALGAARWLIIPTRGIASSLKGMVRIVQRHERLGAA